MQITTDLWEHQKKMRDYALDIFDNGFEHDVPFDHPEVRYAWWYAGCGVGKTLSSLAVMQEMGFKRVLVLTKKAAITSAWLDDVKKYTSGLDYVMLGDQVHTPAGAVKGSWSSKKKAGFMNHYVDSAERPVVVVVNYETARLIAKHLQALNFDMVIADESHKLKSHSSKQSKTLARALMRVSYKIIMTGTGWSDRPTDVYGQVRFQTL